MTKDVCIIWFRFSRASRENYKCVWIQIIWDWEFHFWLNWMDTIRRFCKNGPLDGRPKVCHNIKFSVKCCHLYHPMYWYLWPWLISLWKSRRTVEKQLDLILDIDLCLYTIQQMYIEHFETYNSIRTEVQSMTTY